MSLIYDELRAGRNRFEKLLDLVHYRRLLADGLIFDGEPIELIEGSLVLTDRSAPGADWTSCSAAHANVLARITNSMKRPWRERQGCWHTCIQRAITLSNDSEPEPDIALVRGCLEDYKDRHPERGDILLVVEVADNSVQFDQTVKLRTYAKAGLPLYLIVNIPRQQVEVSQHPEPETNRYLKLDVYDFGQSIPLTIADQSFTIPVSDFLA